MCRFWEKVYLDLMKHFFVSVIISITAIVNHAMAQEKSVTRQLMTVNNNAYLTDKLYFQDSSFVYFQKKGTQDSVFRIAQANLRNTWLPGKYYKKSIQSNSILPAIKYSNQSQVGLTLVLASAVGTGLLYVIQPDDLDVYTMVGIAAATFWTVGIILQIDAHRNLKRFMIMNSSVELR